MIIKHSRWFITLLAFLGVIICYMDRSALAYAIHPMQLEFGLNNNQFGLLLSAFGFGYVATMVLGGVLIDKHGARYIWGVAAFIWSIATICMGIFNSFTILILLRVILGATEAPSFPALSKATTEWLPVKERNRALSFGLAAVPLASVIGAPLSTFLIIKYNWHIMFIVLGAIGVIWALVWVLMFRDNPKKAKYVSEQESQYIEKAHANTHHTMHTTTKTALKFIITNKTFLINNYAFFAFGYLLFFGITWLPGYLEQSFHLGLKHTGGVLTFAWILATITILLNGYISDYIWQKTHSLWKSRSLLMGVGLFLSALAFLPAIMLHNEHIAIVAISFALAFGLAPNSCFYSLNADLAPDKVATSLAIMDTFLAVSAIVAPLITGYLSHVTGDFKIAIAIMLVLNVSAAVLVLFVQDPDHELKNKPVI